MKKHIFITLGGISLALAILGIFLPVLPTTPLLLLTAWLWMRSSDRLYQWLITHPKMGPYIQDFQVHRSIPLHVKITAITLLWLTIGISIWLVQPLWLRLMLFCIATAVTIHIMSYSTKK